MEIVKLKASTKDYIWGGNRLRDYGKTSSSDKIAESWEVSFHDAGPSTIDSGNEKGKFLKDIVTKEDLGSNCDSFQFFPILNKFIDAKDNLSIQVHPNDEYALKNEHSYGKTEMWYVVDADEGACLYVGFNKDVTGDEIAQRIENNTLMEIMNRIEVKKGDCYFIPAETIHAIGKGCLVYEIQENSNLTYRVYDYGRKDAQGKQRELHVEKAIAVLNKNKTIPENLTGKTLANCKYFTVKKYINPEILKADENSFLIVTVISGIGTLNEFQIAKGDTYFIPAKKIAKLTGDMTIITTQICSIN